MKMTIIGTTKPGYIAEKEEFDHSQWTCGRNLLHAKQF